ncbi:MAG: hypothetical protein KA144_15855 [Xanthomonadaceae bacterium]|nr:hypothetical protein [Xanthomonadaceae bacterium]
MFVACGNVLTAIDENGPKRIPDDEIVWHAYANADTPFFARLRGIDTNTSIAALDALLGECLHASADIVLVEEP